MSNEGQEAMEPHAVTGNNATSCNAENAEGCSDRITVQTVVVLQKMNKDLVKELQALRKETMNMNKEMSRKLDMLTQGSGGVEESNGCGRSAARSNGSRKESDGNAGKGSWKKPEYLAEVMSKRRCIDALLQWSVLTTVMTFNQSYTMLRAWLSEGVRSRLSTSLCRHANTSGFSAILYSATRNIVKTALQREVGHVWLFILRSAIVSIVMDAKRNEFTSDKLPAWLKLCGKRSQMTILAGDVVGIADVRSVTTTVSRDGISAPLSKRAKPTKRLDLWTDPLGKKRKVAFQEIRCGLLEQMTKGRTNARKYLFRELLFLVEKLQSYESVTKAQEDGFSIDLHDAVSEEEESPGDASDPDAIWSIPLSLVLEADCDANEEQVAERASKRLESNMRQYNELQERFPSLRVTLKYKRRVNGRPQRSNVVSDLGNGDESVVYWDTEEEKSLHKIALGVLVEMYSAKAYGVVLESCGVSLRAVHVIAIALRGLLQQSIGEIPSTMETLALGRVTEKHVDTTSHSVTAMLSPKDACDDKKTVAIIDIRKEKLEMTWRAFEMERDAQDEALSSVDQTNLMGGDVDDVYEDDDDWFKNAGKNGSLED